VTGLRMDRKKQNSLIKRYQLEHLVPLVLTLFSFYIWFISFSLSLVYFLGIGVSIIGLFIWWSAKITLGENWDAGYGKPGLKKLVTTGIYSKICHPLYWGINLTLIGLCLVSLNPRIIIPSILIVIYFFWRMKVENLFLTKTLGKRYLSYKNSTWI